MDFENLENRSSAINIQFADDSQMMRSIIFGIDELEDSSMIQIENEILKFIKLDEIVEPPLIQIEHELLNFDDINDNENKFLNLNESDIIISEKELNPKYDLNNILIFCENCGDTTKYVQKQSSRCCDFTANFKYKCENCSRLYKHISSLYKHWKYQCGKESRFVCPHCDYKSCMKDNFDRHMKAKHDPSRIYFCTGCGKQYKYRAKMLAHAKNCGLPLDLRESEYFSCDKCDYKSEHKHIISRHIGNKHK